MQNILKLLANMKKRDNTFAMCMFDISQLIAVAKARHTTYHMEKKRS